MGLAVVYGIVKAHEGAIRIESKISEGTAVEVLFPCSDMVEQDPDTKEFESSAVCNERVLFVDDELQIVKLSRNILKGLGYTVTATTSSLEALERLSARPDDFDLIITDMSMPRLSGDQLALEAKKRKPEIPIILCTGYSKKISPEKAAAMGINALLMKPVAVDELAETIRDVLDKKTG